MKRPILSSRLLAAASAFALPAAAYGETLEEDRTLEELRDLSIEELAQIPVTAVSKRAEPLAEAPAAIFVINQEQIAESAALSLPELLREAPNLQVQQIDARQFAVSARGFNGYETANKLLALVDGRSIYTPLFSGILWELHAPILDDLQQIEVVSGPGGTLYGPNAVNGVISISSKSALDTVGGLVRATTGAAEQTAALRYGIGLGGNAAVRVYGNWYDRDGLPGGALADVDDGYAGYQIGFRADAEGEGDSFTLQGDLFDTDTRLIEGEGDKGGNILARWTHRLGGDYAFQLQAYYDDYERRFILVEDALETVDASAQLTGSEGRHQFVVGAGVRTTRDRFFNGLAPITLDPASKRLWIFNGFVQDEVALTDTLRVTAGVKVEDSSLSGTELLPNLRLAWQASERTLFWSAVSRAVRTPSRIDRDLSFLPFLAPARDFATEKLTAIEAGYRGQPTSSTSLSVSVFYNLYDDIRTTEFQADGSAILANGLHGHTYGVEAWVTQQVMPWWRLELGLATLAKHFETDQGHVDLTGGEAAGNDPDFKVAFRSRFDLSDAVYLNVGGRVVDELEDPPVDSFIEAEAKLGWRLSPEMELFVAGSNLLHETHWESGDNQRGQAVERKVFAGTRVRF